MKPLENVRRGELGTQKKNKKQKTKKLSTSKVIKA